MILRTAEAKKDLERSWHRPDRPFFAAGACHILAGVFLEAGAEADYRPFLVRPKPGFRGSHVFAANARFVFDYHGYTRRDRYLAHYLEKAGRFFPGWRGQIIELFGSPCDELFCREYQHRSLNDYLHDPRPRALAYVRRFSGSGEKFATAINHPCLT